MESKPQDASVQNQNPGKLMIVSNFEISNPLYKISVNGQFSVFQDDNYPSGAVTLKIEKPESFFSYVSKSLKLMSDQNSVMPQEQSLPTQVDNVSSSQDSYRAFLVKASDNLGSVAKEIAAKSQLTKDGEYVIELRREKNLEFLLNETPIREVLGKFNQ